MVAQQDSVIFHLTSDMFNQSCSNCWTEATAYMLVQHVQNVIESFKTSGSSCSEAVELIL